MTLLVWHCSCNHRPAAMGKGMGAIGNWIDLMIHPLLYIGNAAIFVCGLAFMIAGGYLIVGIEEAAVGTAVGVFMLGIFCMYLAGVALFGLLKKSSLILTVVSLLLVCLLVGLFAAMIVCLALGFQVKNPTHAHSLRVPPRAAFVLRARVLRAVRSSPPASR